MSDIKKRDTRKYYWTPITIEELGIGYPYRARLANYSSSGIYFETDLLLYQEAKVYVGIQNSADTLFPEHSGRFLVEIIWRNRLSENFFNYGYGAKIAFDHAEKKSLANIEAERKELRKSPRKRFSKPTYFKFENKFYQGATKNVNRTGVFIISGAKFSNGDEFKFVVLGKKKYAVVKGEVVHSNLTGFGVKFKSLLKIEKLSLNNNSATN
jgi:hypothetical protein